MFCSLYVVLPRFRLRKDGEKSSFRVHCRLYPRQCSEFISDVVFKTRPVYSFRPNLKNPEHQRAWEKFQSVPEGQKSQYLVQAILEKEDRKWLEEVIQKTIKESVRELGICGTTEQSTTKLSSEEIPDQMMDFLSQMENL